MSRASKRLTLIRPGRRSQIGRQGSQRKRPPGRLRQLADALLLLAGGAALSRRLPHSERARLLHPLLGLGALLLALVQVFFGLSLLPP